ncbi:hypothetical protein OKW28_004745 [Paraburkholderia sp. 40]
MPVSRKSYWPVNVARTLAERYIRVRLSRLPGDNGPSPSLFTRDWNS